MGLAHPCYGSVSVYLASSILCCLPLIYTFGVHRRAFFVLLTFATLYPYCSLHPYLFLHHHLFDIP